MRRSFVFGSLILNAAGVLGCAPAADEVQAINPPSPTSTKLRNAPASEAPPPAKESAPPAETPATKPPTKPVDKAKPAATPIDPLFVLAKKDPNAVTDLVIQGSARIRVSEPDEARALGDRLEPFLKRMFFSGESFKGSDAVSVRHHVVKAGETPWKLAPLFKIDAALLERDNPSSDPTKLRIGQRLKIVDLSKGELEIEIDLAHRRLALWHLREDSVSTLLMYVPISCGAATTPTPTGTTKVSKRIPPERGSAEHAAAAIEEAYLGLDADALDVERLAIRAAKAGAKIAPTTVTQGDIWLSPTDLTRLVEAVREGSRVVITG